MTTTLQLDTRKIRRTLQMAFDESEFTGFCSDCFPEIYDKFSQGIRYDDKITLFLDYCRRHPTGFERLLDHVRKEYHYQAQSRQTSTFHSDSLEPLIDALSAYIDSSSQIVGTTKDKVGSGKETHSSSLSPKAKATLKTCFQRNHPQILAALQAEQHHEANDKLHALYRAFLNPPPDLGTIRSTLAFLRHESSALGHLKMLLQQPTLQRLVRRGGAERRREYERMVFGRG